MRWCGDRLSSIWADSPKITVLDGRTTNFIPAQFCRVRALKWCPKSLFWHRSQDDGMSQMTPLDANFIRSARPYLEALPPDLRGVISLLQGYHHAGGEQLVETRDLCVNQFETMWNSWSWRSLRPIRNFVRRCRRLPPERKPQINSIFDAQRAIRSIKSDATWHVTRPLRALRKLARKYFRS